MKLLHVNIGDVLQRARTKTMWLIVSKQKKYDAYNYRYQTICGFFELSSYEIFYGDLEVDDTIDIICRVET